MSRMVSPLEAIMMHPDDVDLLQPKTKTDNALVEALRWGFALHPEEERKVNKATGVAASLSWSGVTAGYEDVVEWIDGNTVNSRLPIAGPAEYIISLRRFHSAQPANVRNGKSWRLGAELHLKKVLLGN